LIDLSVITLDKLSPPLFAMLPTKPFKSSWGHEVRSLTLLADSKGLVTLLDVEGHILANHTLNATEEGIPAYAPKQIIEPSHKNDNLFAILSAGRLDNFRIKFVGEGSQKSLLITHEWSKALEKEGIKGDILSAVSTRQKGQFRISLID